MGGGLMCLRSHFRGLDDGGIALGSQGCNFCSKLLVIMRLRFELLFDFLHFRSKRINF
jgi:hypothetical protein